LRFWNIEVLLLQFYVLCKKTFPRFLLGFALYFLGIDFYLLQVSCIFWIWYIIESFYILCIMCVDNDDCKCQYIAHEKIIYWKNPYFKIQNNCKIMKIYPFFLLFFWQYSFLEVLLYFTIRVLVFPILASRWTGNHPQEELATFGSRSLVRH
jgi:hypothetical protein